MFWKLRNRYVEILAKKGVSLKNREKFLKNADEIGIFDDTIEDDCYMDYDGIDVIYSENKEKILDIGKEPTLINNDGITLKVDEELEKCVEENKKRKEDKNNVINIFRYGRNKLHEAIIHRDMCSVKRYALSQELILQKDNNNLTPIELAYYEGFTEAFEFLENMLQSA